MLCHASSRSIDLCFARLSLTSSWWCSAGDMVVEYIGSLVRPVVADLLEAQKYNQLVGAGRPLVLCCGLSA